MVKTPEEIKKALACVCDTQGCENCAYAEKVNDEEFGEMLRFHCSEIYADALAYIQQLESRLAQVERYAKEMAYNLDCSACTWCEYFDSDYTNEACKECRTYNEGFKLRSIGEENTKEDTK